MNSVALSTCNQQINSHEGVVVNLFNDDCKRPVIKVNTNRIPHKAEYIRSLDDINKLRDYYKSHKRYRDDMMLVLGICTGLRVSDLCSLDVGDVVDKNGKFKEYIDIIEKKTGKHSSGYDDKCLITDAMKIAIATYLNSKEHWDVNEPLLYSRKPNKNGEHRIAEESGWRIIKQAQRAVGLDYNLGSHSMRKTFANISACCGKESNIDMNKLLQIQHMLKHSDYKTTMRYLNLNSIFTARARCDVSDFILGKTKYNDLTEALISNDKDEKLDRILSLIDDIINADGDGNNV